jgi:hypothetical protein
MAAELFDDERLNDEQHEELPAESTLEEQQEPTQSDEDVIPEKYAGKSLQDIVRMHQEAEKLVGRQSSEVGDLRKVVDQYIQTQLSSTTQAPEQETTVEDEDDFFTDPDKAMQRAIDNHPSIKQANEFNSNYTRQNAVESLKGKHPEMQQILADPKFGEWIQGSTIRTKLFVQADKEYDAEAADELFSLWKDRRQVVSNTADIEKQTRKTAVKKASTGAATGSAETSSRKIYRRSDIIKLMQTDPDRYDSLSDEIMQAYSEGRVK